jgi:hypothetical protein
MKDTVVQGRKPLTRRDPPTPDVTPGDLGHREPPRWDEGSPVFSEGRAAYDVD